MREATDRDFKPVRPKWLLRTFDIKLARVRPRFVNRTFVQPLMCRVISNENACTCIRGTAANGNGNACQAGLPINDQTRDELE